MSDYSTKSQLIAQTILADLSNRRGLRQALEECDAEVQREILNKWCEIIDSYIVSTSKPKVIYKIQSDKGLFSSGGCTPHFTAKGKVWTGKGGITNHLHILDSRGSSVYRANNAKIVAYELSENMVGEQLSIDEWMGVIASKKLKREQLLEAARKLAAKEERKKLYTQLKKEFD